MTTSMPKRLPVRLSIAIGLAAVLLPLAAQAQRRSPLADAPAIRKRVELRETRLELGAGFMSTLNQDFYHTVLFNGKIGFHFTDWLSIAAFGGVAVANLSTSFQSRVTGSLFDTPMATREPSLAQAQATMQKISSMFGVQLEFTPFTGKFSLFGKLFAHYDFYGFLGPGFINVTPTDASSMVFSPSCDGNTTTSCGDTGLKPGGNIGLGLHTFFNDWMALNIELRDIVAQLNPSGRDVNGDGVADQNDLTWSSTYSVLANLVFYLPPGASISP